MLRPTGDITVHFRRLDHNNPFPVTMNQGKQKFRDKLQWEPWSDDLAIGIASIDDDHRQILRLIGTLYDAVGCPDPQAAISDTMATLTQYVEHHFRREETLLELARFSALEAHRSVHDTFRDYVRLQAQDDSPQNATQLLSYLINWWVGHIATDDKFYREQVLLHPDAIAIAEAIPPMPCRQQ